MRLPRSQAPLGNALHEALLRLLGHRTSKRSFSEGVPKRSLGTRVMRNEESDKLEIPMHAILRCLLPLACCLLPCFAAADELVDAQFLRDYTITRGFMLGRPTSAKPTPDGSAVLFLRSPPRSPVMHLFEFDVATKQTREL